ncbi:MAG: hypothetical protein E7159_02455 [Firmicutes bacterium]|nr:hypothetical protein [Bacillota bacterium]
MKDFDKIYDELYSLYKDKTELIENEKKQADNYALKKMIKPIVSIIVIFIFLVLITKSLEILILLIFIPGPLWIYYCMSKGSKIRANITHNMDIMDEIYNTIITNSYEGLMYSNQAKGISKETYDNGCFENYTNYYSEAELNGILNNKNKIEMSYVATSNEYKDRDKRPFKEVHYLFRGYLLLIVLNNKSNIKMRISEKKVEYLDSQGTSIKNDDMINNIQNILKEFKKENNIATDCTFINNQMYLRVLTNSFSIQVDNILDKENLRKYFDSINKIINLANEILKEIDE